jgi:hypothetical protein
VKLCHLQENGWNWRSHVKLEKLSSEIQISHIFTHVQNLDRKTKQYDMIVKWPVCGGQEGGRVGKGKGDQGVNMIKATLCVYMKTTY